MNITLSDEAAATLEFLLEGGAYPDAESAVEAGIQALLESDPRYRAELRELLNAGLRSLDSKGGRPLNRELGESIKRAGRQRLAARGRASS